MRRILFIACVLPCTILCAQQKSLVNTSASKFAMLRSPDMSAVHWTTGFWADRFRVCKDAMLPHLWKVYTDADVSHAYKNFEIAAGLDTGSHRGPSFHDGDFYKLIESAAAVYAVTKDKKLDSMMDAAIATIAKAQRADGYIYTKAMIEQRKNGTQGQFQDRLSFEAYNIGHLMTAGCVHFRATGKTTLLEVARKATDYLYTFYKQASPTLARNAICPSHYMGTVEMYRTTGDPRYLELARHLIDIKGKIDDGTDDNQDRIPFRDQVKATGHAVRANYLYAGAADLYAETGDPSLKNVLDLVWDDVTRHKMYITGGCGSLYDGVSPDGTSYNPNDVQKIHQAYGRDYQLPNLTAHNETCANIGNVLWNWRMFQLSGDARYTDIVELALYNSVLSGGSLDGTKFLYTNPLAWSADLPFRQRWSKDRVGYISLSDCCPPNLVRTIAEVSDYAYSISDKGLWVNIFGGSRLETRLADGAAVSLHQDTAYPWNGLVKITIDKTVSSDWSLFVRIPGWTSHATLSINGTPFKGDTHAGTYAEMHRKWKTGDVVTLDFNMQTELIEANPLVEESRNQVAVKRGPIVYCAEAADLSGNKLANMVISAKTRFVPASATIAGSAVGVLTGRANFVANSAWNGKLYRPINQKETVANIRLVPYYAWGNRGLGDMSVWLPFTR